MVESLFHRTNLWDVRRERLGTFSGGMRQRFGVAVALLGDPGLIIVDEPTAGLDPEECVRFLNLLSATCGPRDAVARLTDWFETLTLWDVRTERAVAEPTGSGAYVVTLDVVAKKVRADAGGLETEVPMGDLVEIGVFPPDGDREPGEALHLRRHRIRSGAQTLRITVPRKPARAGIDPWGKLIDRQRGDNVVAVEVAGPAASLSAGASSRGPGS